MPQRANVRRVCCARNGNSSGRPRRSGCAPPAQHAGIQQPGDVGHGRPDHRRCGPPALPPRPSAPARTGRASRCARSRRRPPGRQQRRDSIGAQRQRGGIARHIDPRAHRARSSTGIDLAHRPAVPAAHHPASPTGPMAQRPRQNTGSSVTAPSAVVSCQSTPRAAAARGPPAHRRQGTGRPRPGTAAARAGPAASLTEIVIEADDAVHFGARQVERLGDQRHRSAGHSRTRPAAHAGWAGSRPC